MNIILKGVGKGKTYDLVQKFKEARSGGRNCKIVVLTESRRRSLLKDYELDDFDVIVFQKDTSGIPFYSGQINLHLFIDDADALIQSVFGTSANCIVDTITMTYDKGVIN